MTLELDTSQQACALADILLGAAWSDHFYAASELVQIIAILCDTLKVEALPPDVSKRLKAFDPQTFDLAAACTQLPLEASGARRALLEVVARVINADAVVHEIEDDYLDAVAEAIGMDAFVEAADFAD